MPANRIKITQNILSYMKELYVKVDFPDIQEFQEHPRWNECVYADLALNPNIPCGTCFVPVDLYDEVMKRYSPSTGYQYGEITTSISN